MVGNTVPLDYGNTFWSNDTWQCKNCITLQHNYILFFEITVMLIGFWKQKRLAFVCLLLSATIDVFVCMSSDDRQKFTVEFLHKRSSFHFYPLQKT
jgi:hypothetical protein